MEELGNGSLLAVPAEGVHPVKAGPHEAGGGGVVPGQTDGAHTAAEGAKIQALTEAVLGRLGGEVHKAVQVHAVIGEGGVVGQHAIGIVVYPEALLPGLLHHKAVRAVAYHPVQRRGGGARVYGDIHQPDRGQFPFKVLYRGEGAQHPEYELIGGKVSFPGNRLAVPGVFREVESGHGEALLVGGLSIEGIAPLGGGHAYHGVPSLKAVPGLQGDAVVPGGDGHLLAEAVVEVHGAAKVYVPGFHGDASAHICPAFHTGYS